MSEDREAGKSKTVGEEVDTCRQRQSVTSINFAQVSKAGYWGEWGLRIGAGRRGCF